jgi:hypothetical protein
LLKFNVSNQIKKIKKPCHEAGFGLFQSFFVFFVDMGHQSVAKGFDFLGNIFISGTVEDGLSHSS